jgi:hypothetical protein
MKPKYTAFILLFIALALAVSVVIKTFFSSKTNPEIMEKYKAQKNPFSVQKDSAEIVWARASKFLELRKLELVGGDLQKSNSVIFMPYYNDFHKGTSLKIERKQLGDSTVFTVNVWNSGKPVPLGAKEIALFMATSFDRKKH